MSNTVWIILASSIPVALIIMVISYIMTNKKVDKIRKQHSDDKDSALTNKQNKALLREGHGVLLWDLKEKTTNPLADAQLEFAINTIIRNEYKKTMVLGNTSEYEIESIRKIAKQTIVKKDADFVLLFASNTLNDVFDEVYKTLNVGGMIVVANAYSRDKEVKRLLSYLKLSGLTYEHQKIDRGVILVVK